MEQLWAPWRAAYILSEKTAGCFLCQKPGENKDASNYILYRGRDNFAIMNMFPYNPGHLLVATYKHVGELEDLSPEEAAEHLAVVTRVVRVMRKAFNPAGFNIGLNLGAVAGAGVVGHLHTHIVPRWDGDTNFMPVIAGVKVISNALESNYRELKKIIDEGRQHLEP